MGQGFTNATRNALVLRPITVVARPMVLAPGATHVVDATDVYEVEEIEVVQPDSLAPFTYSNDWVPRLSPMQDRDYLPAPFDSLAQARRWRDTLPPIPPALPMVDLEGNRHPVPQPPPPSTMEPWGERPMSWIPSPTAILVLGAVSFGALFVVAFAIDRAW